MADELVEMGVVGIGDIAGAGIEPHGVLRAVIDHTNARKIEDRIELARGEDIIIGKLGIELSVGVHTELEDIVGIAMREEHGLFALRGSHEHINGERLIAQAAVDAADSSRGDRAIEMQRCSGGYTCSVGYALDLEVVVSIKVIACYGFVEPEQQVIAHAEYSVDRFGFAEHAWRPCIFDTRDDGRSFADEA